VCEVLAAGGMIAKVCSAPVNLPHSCYTFRARLTSAGGFFCRQAFPPPTSSPNKCLTTPRAMVRRRFLDHWQPFSWALFLFIEYDLWPNRILGGAARRICRWF